MPSIDTEAVILRSIRFSEADVVLSIYSPTAGRISGIARVIAPVHTPLDGDVTFALASGSQPSTAFSVGTVAALLAERAVRTAVRTATRVRDVPTAAERRG